MNNEFFDIRNMVGWGFYPNKSKLLFYMPLFLKLHVKL